MTRPPETQKQTTTEYTEDTEKRQRRKKLSRRGRIKMPPCRYPLFFTLFFSSVFFPCIPCIPWLPSSSLRLDENGAALAAADAERRQASPQVASPQFLQQGNHQPR